MDPRPKAGIDSGDIITAVNGQSVKDARELARLIGGLCTRQRPPKLDVLQQGEEQGRQPDPWSTAQYPGGQS